MISTRVTVLGGTGFLGRWIVEALARRGASVRVAVRRPERASFEAPATDGATIEACFADVRDEASVAAALDGAAAVINVVGLYVERPGASFDAIHVEGAARVARQAAHAGLDRLVHMSGIGADPGSPSAYVRARAEGERVVTLAFPGATILRPSAIFGPGDAFLTTFAKAARRAPVLPLFGSGRTAVQPVYAGDVASAVVAAITREDAPARIYELGGPDIYTYRALMELVMRQTGRRRLLVPVPFAIWDGLARLLAVLPNPPITRDTIALVRQDNLVAPGTYRLADLGVTPTPVTAILPDYIV